MLNRIFREEELTFLKVHLDDITTEERIKESKNKIYLNKSKFQYGMQEITALGHLISGEYINPLVLHCIQEYPI